MPTLDEIIKLSEVNLKELSKKLKDLEVLKQDIETTKREVKQTQLDSAEIPELFDGMFQKIIKLTEEYTITLGGVTKVYLDGNNILFVEKLNELGTQNQDLKKEVSRLLEVDYMLLYKDLQKIFISETKKDIAIELAKFDEKSENLQVKIVEFGKEIDRIGNIDLEKHFDQHQKTLAEIFGAINSINITLTSLTQTFSSIFQNIGSIQNILIENHKESKQLISSTNTELINLLNRQNEIRDKKYKQLSEQIEIINITQKKNKLVLNIICSILVLGTVGVFIIIGIMFNFKIPPFK